MATKKKKTVKRKQSMFERYPYLQLVIVVSVIILAVFGIVYNKTKRTIVPAISSSVPSITPTPTVSPSIEAFSLEMPPLYPEVTWTQTDAKELLHFSGTYHGSSYGGDMYVSGTRWSGSLPFSETTQNDVWDYYREEFTKRGWTSKLSIDSIILDTRKVLHGVTCTNGRESYLGYQGNDIRLIILESVVNPCSGFDQQIPNTTVRYTLFLSDPISFEMVKEMAEKSR